MKTGGKYRVVLVSCGSLTEGRRIARSVISKRLAACVNITLSPVESIYSWKGKIEKAREYVLIFKTAATRLAVLEKEVKRLHGYDVPEFIVLSIVAGANDYLAWLRDSLRMRNTKKN
jgi:periplasmic divalent cation tolerance protein